MIKMLGRLLGRNPTRSLLTVTETLADPGGQRKLDIVGWLLALPSDRGRWRAEDWQLLRHSDAFSTVDWGLETEEIVRQWNHLLDPEHMISLPPVVAALTVRLSYRGHTCDVPSRASREDCFIAVMAIAQLAKAEIDTRLCRDSLETASSAFFLCRVRILERVPSYSVAGAPGCRSS